MVYKKIGKKIPNLVMSPKVSLKQIERYPVYLNVLLSLRNSGINKVNSHLLAEALGVSEEQVRKDLQIVSPKSSKPGCSRDVDILINHLKDYLGYNSINKAVLVGVGHLGSALLSFKGFDDYGLDIVAGFDIDPSLTGESLNDKPIYSIFNLDNKIKELGVEVAIVATPRDVTQEIVNKLINSGIKAIWNFVPIHLEHPKDVVVENMDLARSLAVFFHRINNKREA